ncbi:MAG: transposase [Nitrospira sp.]|nr:transposase [Nitrospira sp.]MBS0178683.1 transposase [Nitrospira sp.]MCC7472866.1 transposase [Candidatus Nomurabacteria bacterium]
MRSQFTDRQKQQILKEGHSKGGVTRLCRKYGISVSTFYRWKARLDVPKPDPMLHLRSLQQENRRLKHRVAELSLDYTILRSALINDRENEC